MLSNPALPIFEGKGEGQISKTKHFFLSEEDLAIGAGGTLVHIVLILLDLGTEKSGSGISPIPGKGWELASVLCALFLVVVRKVLPIPRGKVSQARGGFRRNERTTQAHGA